MEHLLQIQLYNQFQGDAVITWGDLLKTMSGTFNRSRDEVFAGMNELIDSGRIVMPKTDTYCLPGTLAKIKRREQEEQAWKKAYPDSKKITRAEFDKLNPRAQMDFCTNGGRIV